MYTDFPNHNFTKQTKSALASLAVDVMFGLKIFFTGNTIGVQVA